MKATGIVRRIDDLGRVVIPKEIRRTMRIREGDPLEIYTDKDGEVIFKKYSPMGELSSFAAQICDTMSKTCSIPVAVADRDSVIAVSGAPRRDLVDKTIGEELERVMEGRQVYLHRQGAQPLRISDSAEKYFVSLAAPIVSGGDVTGCVMFVAQGEPSPLGDTEQKLAQTVAGFLGKQMET